MIRSVVLGGFLLLGPCGAWAHGTGWRLTDEKTVAVELYYADGDEMPFADVKVFSPADAKVPVLHGRADGRGRVAFVPDRDGEWTLVASDGDGHGVNAAIPVTLAGAAVQAAPARAPLEMKLLLIGSIVLNVGLLLIGWKWFGGPRRTSAPAGTRLSQPS